MFILYGDENYPEDKFYSTLYRPIMMAIGDINFENKYKNIEQYEIPEILDMPKLVELSESSDLSKPPRPSELSKLLKRPKNLKMPKLVKLPKIPELPEMVKLPFTGTLGSQDAPFHVSLGTDDTLFIGDYTYNEYRERVLKYRKKKRNYKKMIRYEVRKEFADKRQRKGGMFTVC